MPEPIPGPRPRPLVANLPDIDTDAPVQSFMALAREYGPIYRLELGGREIVVLSSQELVNEVCNEERFDKKIHSALRNVRDFTGDGLFTAETSEPNWGIAHRILMPVFGPASLRSMFSQMLDIAEQLLLKWERQGESHVIHVTDDMTRLTLDTLALCAFDYRFNSFYEKDLHPFIGALVRALSEAGARGRRLPLQNRLMLLAAHQYDEDIRLMNQIADQLINERKKNPTPASDHKDILDIMLTATDPQTGQRLSDENVRYQMVTFLIAGHETTSGLLSFAIHELLSNPSELARAREEVERALGTEEPRFEQLQHLTYIDQILKETLRLWPPAPLFGLYSREKETTIGGKYAIRAEQTVYALATMLHRDPAVWGPDPEKFDPSRFSPEQVEKRAPNSWKPFGNGQRACIGRPFAMQEATLVLAMLLQRFDISQADANYKLKVRETLTLKPLDLFIHAKHRDAKRRDVVIAKTQAAQAASGTTKEAPMQASNGIPIKVLFGSNAGSSESFAQRIASDAAAQGYVPSLAPLDSAAGHLSKEGAVIVVTASYEGRPPDNARKFVEWVFTLAPRSLEGVKFAVFGCGNKDWARTYQAIPKLVDERLAAAGAQRLIERGEANAHGDFFGDFDRWYSGFWPQIGAAFGQQSRVAAAPSLQLEFIAPVRDPIARHAGMDLGTIVVNRELADMTAPGARSKRHIEIALPEKSKYRAGDYLAVLPLNPPENIDRALRRFNLSYDAQVMLHCAPGVETFFPVGKPVMVGELLSSYVELAQPATQKQIEALAVSTLCPPEKKELKSFAANQADYTSQILEKYVSVLDLLEKYQSSAPSFAAFLEMLPPLKQRQYSISSSPLWSENHCTLTIAVLDAPALSGKGRYHGVASNYLASSRPGTRIAVTVKPSQVAFHPPESLSTPIIMVCAGTGLAPFRGFLQDRALRAQQTSTQPGAALLFFGCEHSDVDYLYKDELGEWNKKGILDVRCAFNKSPEDWGKYVQDRLWNDRADVVALVKQGATFFLCGDGRRLAPAVHETCVRIYQEAKNATREAAEQWMTEMERTHSRYVADVFA
jgi:cytochrome P450/NADPH-cytochrome P450 reductase